MSPQKLIACLLLSVVVLAMCVEAKIAIQEQHQAVARGKRSLLKSLRFKVEKAEPEESSACVKATWTLMSSCSASCGGGIQEFHLAVFSGTCTETRKTAPCHEEECPKDCKCDDWSDEPDCPSECGGTGTIKVTRTCTPGNDNGRKCGPTQEIRTCNQYSCPRDCEYSQWHLTSECDKKCDTGKELWTREIKLEARNGGRPCVQQDLRQELTCNEQICPVDCNVTEWAIAKDTPACSKTCDSGEVKLVREITQKAEHGGVPCPETETTTLCNVGPCPEDCVVTPWEMTKICSHTCGTEGTMEFERHGSPDPATTTVTGLPCPPLRETVACNRFPCPVDCVVSAWVKSGGCDSPSGCGGGKQKYVREESTPAKYGGAKCPHLETWVPCETEPCYLVQAALPK